MRNTLNRFFSSLIREIQKRPLTLFFVLLLCLFGLIFGGNSLRKAYVKQEEPKVTAKKVEVFKVGGGTKLLLSAQVEKTGSITVLAQTAGIVKEIKVSEGQQVKQNAALLALANSYSGGNAQTIQRQLAQEQYNNAANSLTGQKEAIGKQRALANRTEDSSRELREIANKALEDSRAVIALNEGVLSAVTANIQALEASGATQTTSPALAQARQAEAQLRGAIAQIRVGVRSGEYANDENKAPAELGRLARDLTLTQLDIQEKALQTGVNVAKLNLQLTQLNESLLYPKAMFQGVVERVFVSTGQTVTPGTPLLVLSGESTGVKAVVLAPRQIAQQISMFEQSFLVIGKEKVGVVPDYVSSVPTVNSLYSVTFQLPEDQVSKVFNAENIEVEVPMILSDETAGVYVPLESVYQTQDSASVYVQNKDKAEMRTIQLGEVVGGFVEVDSGLTKDDVVILTRTVLNGDTITI